MYGHTYIFREQHVKCRQNLNLTHTHTHARTHAHTRTHCSSSHSPPPLSREVRLKVLDFSKHVLSKKTGLSPTVKIEIIIIIGFYFKMYSRLHLQLTIWLSSVTVSGPGCSQAAVKCHSWLNGYPRPLWSVSSGDVSTQRRWSKRRCVQHWRARTRCAKPVLLSAPNETKLGTGI